MIDIEIPGYNHLKLQHLVLDYNGTLAVDGELIDGVKACLTDLADHMEIHVLTADTFGKAAARLKGVPCTLTVLPQDSQDQAKADYVHRLGKNGTVCVGNGRNDRVMLRDAALGIAVILAEGIAAQTAQAADVICTDILSALALLKRPLRLTATLRS